MHCKIPDIRHRLRIILFAQIFHFCYLQLEKRLAFRKLSLTLRPLGPSPPQERLIKASTNPILFLHEITGIQHLLPYPMGRNGGNRLRLQR